MVSAINRERAALRVAEEQMHKLVDCLFRESPYYKLDKDEEVFEVCDRVVALADEIQLRCRNIIPLLNLQSDEEPEQTFGGLVIDNSWQEDPEEPRKIDDSEENPRWEGIKRG